MIYKHKTLFDSHCHLISNDFDNDRKEVIQRSNDNGVEVIYDISIDIESSKKSIQLAKEYSNNVFSFVGIDPEAFIYGSPFFIGLDKDDSWFEVQYLELKSLIENNREVIAGIGESGMDFYHNAESKKLGKISESDESKSISLQRELFDIHLQLSRDYNLPLSIHSRYAEKECLGIIKNSDTKGIFHSFTGNYEIARQVLDAGWGLGVNGIATFKKATELREVYKKILGNISFGAEPEFFYEKGIYFETDSPFLSPEGKRGERNEPANTKILFEIFRAFMAENM
jgi:TatD DNase family protein